MNTMTFTNNSTKLNADTMNKFQSNIKAAIDDNTNKINNVNTSLTEAIKNSVTAGTNGASYIQLIDGTQICFGKVTLSNELPPKSTAITVKLPNTFKTTDYIVIITKFEGGNNYSHVIEEIRSLTTSSFVIDAWNDVEQNADIKGYMYVAIGKYK